MNRFDRIKEIYGSLDRRQRIAALTVLLGISGLTMIILGGGNENEQTEEIPQYSSEENVWTDYCGETERRLEGILAAIDGVGDVDVMITVSSSEEYIYAQAENTDESSKKLEYVTVRTDSGEEALLKKVNSPVITGVAVVCEGGRGDKVREEIYRTVTAILGISPGRIYVAPME